MELPKAHITPKLESLPKDLRLKADKIIAKKFNIKEKKPQSIADYMKDMFIPDLAQSTIMRKVKGRISVYNGSHLDGYCGDCGYPVCQEIRQNYPTFTWPCNKCGSINEVYLNPQTVTPGMGWLDPPLTINSNMFPGTAIGLAPGGYS